MWASKEKKREGKEGEGWWGSERKGTRQSQRRPRGRRFFFPFFFSPGVSIHRPPFCHLSSSVLLDLPWPPSRERSRALGRGRKGSRTASRNTRERDGWRNENARSVLISSLLSLASPPSPHRRCRRSLLHLQHGRPGPGRGRAQRGGGGALPAGGAAQASSAKRRGHGCARRGVRGDRGHERRIKQKREGKEWREREAEAARLPPKRNSALPLQIFLFVFFYFIFILFGRMQYRGQGQAERRAR